MSLRRAEVLVSGKLHDDLGRDAAVGELGDEAASPAVAGCAFFMPDARAQAVACARGSSGP